MRTEPNGSWGKFQMDAVIPIPLEWGLCSERACVRAIILSFEMHLVKGSNFISS